MRTLQAVLAATVSTLCLFPAHARAEPITFAFSGVVGEVIDFESDLAGVIELSDLFTGSFTFDSALPDGEPQDFYGSYGPLTALSFSVGSYSGGLRPEFSRIEVLNIDGPFLSQDRYEVLAALQAPRVGGLTLSSFRLLRFDFQGDVLFSDALPLVPGEYDDGFFELFFVDDAGDFSARVAAPLDSLEVVPTVAPVPEPATMTLLGLGLVGMGARRWRQRKRA